MQPEGGQSIIAARCSGCCWFIAAASPLQPFLTRFRCFLASESSCGKAKRFLPRENLVKIIFPMNQSQDGAADSTCVGTDTSPFKSVSCLNVL